MFFTTNKIQRATVTKEDDDNDNGKGSTLDFESEGQEGANKEDSDPYENEEGQHNSSGDEGKDVEHSKTGLFADEDTEVSEPDWIPSTRAYLETVDAGVGWKELIETWDQIEKLLKYLSASVS